MTHIAGETAQVIIAGARPVGLMIAAELAARPVRFILVEPRLAPVEHQCAISIGVRRMEHVRRLGPDQTVIGVGVPPPDVPTPDMLCETARRGCSFRAGGLQSWLTRHYSRRKAGGAQRDSAGAGWERTEMNRTCQVAIVGGGPVGIGLAIELGLRGISSIVIERRTGMHNIPKGQNLTPRTLEHFYYWGCVDELRAARLIPPGYSAGGVTAYRTLMSEYWYAVPGREVTNKFYFQDNDRLPQYEMEKVLRKRLEDVKEAEALFGWVATDFEQHADGVTVNVEKDGGGEAFTIEADYIVGCDGAHSQIRDKAGITRSGTEHNQLMVLAVFRSPDLHQLLTRFPERSTFRVMNPELKGYWQFFGRIKMGESFFFHAPVPNETTRENYDFEGLLRSVAGADIKCDFDYVGFWDMRIAVADNYQAGRVFIAGDAAHSHPPYGGYGLNNGLEDARNLGWKLAACLQGWGGEALLRSYTEERRPIFRETADDFIAARMIKDREFFDKYDPQKDRAAFEAGWKEMAAGGGAWVNDYEPNYEGSEVVAGPPGGKSTAHGRHQLKARAGHHLAPQVLSSGKNVFEEVGPGFALLAFGAGDADVAAFEDAAQKENVPFKVIRDSFDGGREAYESRLTLVRPDQYVVWTGDKAPSDAAALMRQVAGR